VNIVGAKVLSGISEKMRRRGLPVNHKPGSCVMGRGQPTRSCGLAFVVTPNSHHEFASPSEPGWPMKK